MKSLRWLPSVLVLSLVPSLAWGDEAASLVEWAKQRVGEGLVQPMAQKEEGRKSFSRSRPAPRERRVRIPRASTTLDKQGKAYVPFAIDVRFGDEWNEDDVVGCAYRESGELFVRIGDEYRPSAFLLGKSVKPVPGVCEPEPAATS